MRTDLSRRQALVAFARVAVRIRWLSLAVGMVGLPFASRHGWIDARAFPQFVALAGFTGLYNGVMSYVLLGWRRRAVPRRTRVVAGWRAATALCDYFALLWLLHLTGGVESPFHAVLLVTMVFLSIVASPWEPILYSALALVGPFSLYFLEYLAWLPHYEFAWSTFLDRYQQPAFLRSAIVYWSLMVMGAGTVAWFVRRELDKREIRLQRRREELAQMQRFQAEVLRQLPVGVVVYGRGGRVLQANPSAETLLQLDLQEHRNLARMPAFKRSGLRAYIESLLAGRELKISDFPFIGVDGQKLWLDLVGIPPNDAQNGILLVEDTSERRAREARERELQERLMQADKFTSLGQMASGVAHELNNPLTAIFSTAQYLQLAEQRDRLDAALLREKIEVVLHHAGRIKELARSLLAYARPHRKQSEEVDVRRAVQELLTFSGPELERGQVELRVKVPETMPPFRGTKNELQQLLLNLLTNARQAIGEGPGHIDVEIDQIVRTDGAALRIIVKDDGPGIPQHVRDRIFEPFFTTKDADTGTGLGLPIVQAIVERYYGALKLESEPGATRFEIVLPFYEAPMERDVGEQTFSPYG